MSKKENTKSKFLLFKFFTNEEENIEADDVSGGGSFVELATQLRMNQEAKAKETQTLSEEIGEYFAGIITDALHMTGTAIGNRIHDMMMGDSHSSDNN